MFKQSSVSVFNNLKDTITKCDQFMLKMRDRRGAVKVQTEKLDPRAKNDRQIFESNENDDEDDVVELADYDSMEEAMQNFDFHLNNNIQEESKV